MQRKKWVCRQASDGTFLMIEIGKQSDALSEQTRSHAIHEDSMPPTMHPTTGEVFDSKSAFRARTKSLGYEEVGNDYKSSDGSFREIHSRDRQESVRDTIYKTLQGYRAEDH